ncbi:MAG: DNA adenine methylase, partial [Victivallales bacterium]|nr:DNA adenine methylase [Victivallales bacterium]
MKPIIKYRGGKAKEIPFFEKYIPDHYGTYFEPFLGGGAVYFHLHPSKAVVNDINPKVMTFYREVRDNYPEMRRQLDQLEKIYSANQKDYLARKMLTPDQRVENRNEELYYSLRDMFNGKIS